MKLSKQRERERERNEMREEDEIVEGESALMSVL